MTPEEHKKKIQEIKKAMKSFPQEIRRQERAYRHEMKILKAFKKINFNPKPL